MSETAFKTGDTVIYGATGLCRIEQCGPIQLAWEKEPQPYYLLKPLGRPGSAVYVPQNNETLVAKMRRPLPKEEVDALLRGMKGKNMRWDPNRNTRRSAFHEVINRRDEEEMLLLIRCIFLQKNRLQASGKKISGADEDILQSAEKLLQQEFAHSLGIAPAEVNDYIRATLSEEKAL